MTAYQGFSMPDIERAEREIRQDHVRMYGCLPGLVWTRDQAIRKLRAEAASPSPVRP